MLGGKKLILIFGSVVMCAASAIGTYLLLDKLGAIDLQEPITLTFSVDDETKEYDGTPLVPYKYSYSGQLLEGHRPVVYYVGSQTDVGETTSDATVKILDKTGVDVSQEYEIIVEPGTLEVTKKKLTIEFEDQIIKYTGQEIIPFDYSFAQGELVRGHKLSLNPKGGQVETGVLNNLEFDLKVYDGYEFDVTSNYELSYSTGRIEIEAREIELELVNSSKIYDGEEFVPEVKLKSGTLVESHTMEVKFSSELVDSFSKTTKSLDVTILDKKGNDVTNNYDIKGTTVEVEILPQEVHIDLPKLEKTYDGESFKIEFDQALSKITLPEGLQIKYKDIDAYLSSQNAMEEKVVLSSLNFYVEGDDASNYKVEFDNGYIMINKAQVNINVTQKQPVQYNKNKNYNIDEEMEVSIESDIDESLIDVEYGLVNNQTVISLPGSYPLEITKITIDGNEVTTNSKNYEINTNIADFIIGKIQKIVSLPNLIKEYSDEYERDIIDYISIQLSELIGFDDMQISIDESKFSLPSIIGNHVLDGSMIDISLHKDKEFYEFVVKDGQIKINPKTVEINIPQFSKIYGSSEEISFNELSNDIVEVTFNPNNELINDIGKQTISKDFFKIELKNKEEKISNFNIVVNDGYYEITPIPVHIELPKVEFDYDGLSSVDSIRQSIEQSSTLSVQLTLKEVNYQVGEYQLTKDSFVLTGKQYDISKYDVQIVDGYYKINPVHISMGTVLNTSTIMYGDNIKNCITNPSLFISLKDGETITEFDYSIESETTYDSETTGYIKEYVIRIDPNSIFVDGKENTNYVFDITSNSLLVTKRSVSIQVRAGTSIDYAYNGSPLEISGDTIDTSTFAPGDKVSKILLAQTYYALNTLTKQHSIKGIEIVDENGNDVTPYYYFDMDSLPKLSDFNITAKQRLLSLNCPSIEIAYSENLTTDDIVTIIKNSVSVSFNTPLVDGDYIVVEDDLSIEDFDVEPGVHTIGISIGSVYNRYNHDVTDAYDISTYQFTLIISKKDITVVLPTLTKVYDGEPFEISDMISEMSQKNENGEELITFSLNNELEVENFTDTGELILDESFLDYDDNHGMYNVFIIPGKLEIIPQEVNIDLPNMTFIYDDGNDFDYSISTIIDELNYTYQEYGFQIEYDDGYYGYVTEVNDSCPITSDCINVYENDSNYILGHVNNGYIAITKKEVEIHLDPIEVVYTGEDFNYLIDEMLEKVSTTNYELINDGSQSYTNVNKGGYLIDPDLYVYNENYSVTVYPGTLIIKPKVITIDLHQIDEIYSGRDFTDDVRNLVNKDTSEYSIEFEEPDVNYIEVGSYPIKAKTTRVDKNYEVIINPGNITIEKQVIVVDLPNWTYEYSITEDYKIDIENDVNSINYINDNTEELVFELEYSSSYSEIKDVVEGGYKIEADVILYDTKNYSVVVNPGLITITPKKINAQFNLSPEVYTGKNFDPDVEIIVENSIIEGVSDINYISPGQMVDARVYNFEVELTKLNDNYYFENNYNVVTGYFEITRERININLGTHYYIYSPTSNIKGEMVNYINDLSYTNPNTEELIYQIEYVDEYLDIKDVGTYNLKGEFTTKDTTNYEISLTYGTIVINPCEININRNYSLTYDGRDLKNDLENQITSILPLGVEQINYNTHGTMVNVGNYTFELEVVLEDYNNYYIEDSTFECNLTINPKYIAPSLHLTEVYEGYDLNEDIKDYVEKTYYHEGIKNITYRKLEEIKDVGSNYIFEVSFDLISDNYYSSYTSFIGRVDVTKKTLYVSMPTLTYSYNQHDNHEPYVKSVVDNLTYVNPYTNEKVYKVTYKDEHDQMKEVDYYEINADVEVCDNKNYEVIYQPGYVDIIKKEIDLHYSLSKVYTGYDLNVDIKLEVTSYLPEGIASITYTQVEPIVNVGSYTFEIEVELTDENNYSIQNKTITGYVEVTPCVINRSLPVLTLVYNGNDRTVDIESMVNVSNSDYEITLVTEAPMIDVGRYELDVEDVDITIHNPNYQINILTNGVVVIEQKEITINLPSLSKSVSDTGVSINDAIQSYLTNYTNLSSISLDTNFDSYGVGNYIISEDDISYTNKDNVKINFVPSMITITE